MLRKSLVIFLMLYSLLGKAQDTLFLDVLTRLSDQYGVSFSYDPDLIKGVILDEKIPTVQDLSTFLGEKSVFSLEEVSKNEYLLVPQKTQIAIQFQEKSQSDQTITSFYLDIIRGDREVLYQNFISDPKSEIYFSWLPKVGDTLRLVSTSYEPISIPASALILNSTLQVVLKEKVTYLEEIIIENYLAKGISLNVADQTTSIDMEDLALIPGETDGDILASLGALPGINSPDSRPGNVFIRGSSTDQNLILYNNIPIYHKGHYFGTISPYNPATVSQVKVHKNGFNPRLGGRVGGAIEIRSQDNLEKFNGLGISANSLYWNAFGKGMLNEKWGVSVSGRRSLLANWFPPKLEEISNMVYAGTVLSDPQRGVDFDEIDVKYEDYNFNMLYVPNPTSKIKISGLYTNNLTEYMLATDTSGSGENFSYDNEGISLEWDKEINAHTQGKFTSFISNYFVEYNNMATVVSGVVSERGSENRIVDGNASYELQWKVRKNDAVNAGVSSQWTRVTHKFQDSRVNEEPYVSDESSRAFIHSLFANYDFFRSYPFSLQAGGRVEHYSPTSQFYLSPRILSNLDLSNYFTLKASAGRYYQYLSQIKYLQFGSAGFDSKLWSLADDKDVKVIYSDIGMIGGILNLGRLVLDIEAYRKNIENVNYASTLRLEEGTQFGAASWDVKGIDFFAKMQVIDGFSLWASYEYSSQSITFDSLQSVSYTFKNNRPHRYKMGGLYQTGRWKMSYTWKALSGLYGRSIDILAELGDFLIPNENQPPPMGDGGMRPPPFRVATLNDLPIRYPVFSSLDVFITYHIPKTSRRKWDSTIGLSLINLLNSENQIDSVIRGSNQRNLLERYALGFSPNINVAIKW